ncbi:MAG TPA: hypothetical protein VG651_13410 [Stellaceae bacterium]|nr:hypothetical protein [Stellaceae bacterium]
MKTFRRIGAGRHTAEGVIHAGEIVEFEGDMPFRETRRAKPELALREATTGTETGTLQMLELPTDDGGKLKVAYIVLKTASDAIDVHRVSAPRDDAAETFRRAPLPRRQRQRA